jgi:hypothetical protein
MEDGYMKALWELLLRSVSAPLRRSFIVAFGILAVQIQVTKTILQIEYRDVMLGSYFPTTLSVVTAVLAIQLLRYSKAPRSYVAFSVFLLAAIGVGIFAWNAWQYAYNPAGVYEQRHWTTVSRANDRCIMSKKLIAALNKPSKITFLVITEPLACPHVRILNLHPVVTGVDLKGAETIEQTDSGREFTFEGFRRPAVLTFRLMLSDVGSSPGPEACFKSTYAVVEDTGGVPNTQEDKKQ